ncbi:MAG: rod shape-determining protein MreD [Lachnospiraceae bacterium]
MKGIKRKIAYAVLIIIGFLLESMLFPHIALASITPNLMLIITASIGFMRGKQEGMFIGFFCGLLQDVFFGNYIGLYALMYMFIGYGNGFFKRLFYDDDIKLPLALIAGSDSLYGLITYLLIFMLNGDFRFPYYLQHIIIPEMLYTIIVTLIFYHIILRVNQKLEAEEQRSASKFV